MLIELKKKPRPIRPSTDHGSLAAGYVGTGSTATAPVWPPASPGVARAIAVQDRVAAAVPMAEVERYWSVWEAGSR